MDLAGSIGIHRHPVGQRSLHLDGSLGEGDVQVVVYAGLGSVRILFVPAFQYGIGNVQGIVVTVYICDIQEPGTFFKRRTRCYDGHIFSPVSIHFHGFRGTAGVISVRSDKRYLCMDAVQGKNGFLERFRHVIKATVQDECYTHLAHGMPERQIDGSANRYNMLRTSPQKVGLLHSQGRCLITHFPFQFARSLVKGGDRSAAIVAIGIISFKTMPGFTDIQAGFPVGTEIVPVKGRVRNRFFIGIHRKASQKRSPVHRYRRRSVHMAKVHEDLIAFSKISGRCLRLHLAAQAGLYLQGNLLLRKLLLAGAGGHQQGCACHDP